MEQRGFANVGVYLAKRDVNSYKISLNSRKITSAITKQICQQKQRSPGLPSRWDCWKTTSCRVAVGTLPVPRAPAPGRLERGSWAGHHLEEAVLAFRVCQYALDFPAVCRSLTRAEPHHREANAASD